MPRSAHPASMATVLLTRHGETTWNRDSRVQGWAPTPLTDRGHEQARELATRLAAAQEVDRVVVSDLRRATETARYVVRATDAPLVLDPGWRERSFGVYQGLTAEELYDAHPEFSLLAVGYAAVDATPENGESLLDARERVLDAWDRLCEDLADDEIVVVVCHGGPIRMLVGQFEGLDALETLEQVEIGNCSVTTVRIERGAVELVTVGETGEDAIT